MLSGVAVALGKSSVIEADLINRQSLLTQTGEIHNGQTLSSFRYIMVLILGSRVLNEAYTKRCQNRIRPKSVRGSCGGPHCHGSGRMDCRSGADALLAVTNSNPKSRSRGGGQWPRAAETTGNQATSAVACVTCLPCPAVP